MVFTISQRKRCLTSLCHVVQIKQHGDVPITEVKCFGTFQVILRSLSKDVFERLLFQPVVHFCILEQWICPYFLANRLYKRKTLSTGARASLRKSSLLVITSHPLSLPQTMLNNKQNHGVEMSPFWSATMLNFKQNGWTQ